MWIQLEKRNDWGSVYFSRPGKGLSPQGTADIRKYGLRFENGDPLWVRWPNGDETEERVEVKEHSQEIQDMGNRYVARFNVPGFSVDVHGVRRWVSLDEVKVSEASLAAPEKRSTT